MNRLHIHTRWVGLLGALFWACSTGGSAGRDTPQTVSDTLEWALPSGFPRLRVPAENPLTEAGVELGRHLFYDPRLSENQTQSCATCHAQERAFTDGRAQGLGSTGELHPRSPMSLANVGYASALTWANSLVTSLEQQALLPLFGETPVELGWSGKERELLERLRNDPTYAQLFQQAYPDVDDPITLETLTKAIASFERVLISGDSPYDRFRAGERDALTPAARRGMDHFFSEKLECFHCHGGFNLADSVTHEGTQLAEVMYHNTALYNIDGKGAYPQDNPGLVAITGNPFDMGRFKAPTLRNITVTAPYMHDGSIPTLNEAIDHYAAGGRMIASGPYAGDGSLNPMRSEFIRGFSLTPAERSDLLAFLESFTDPTFLTDPRFANPWPTQP